MSRRLSFGLIGCGTIGATHAEALTSISEARLAACCDIIPERARSYGERFGISPEHIHSCLDSFFADHAVEAVSVCTPSGMHADMGVTALESGRPVIVEKPMDVTLEACDRLLAASEKQGKTLGVICQHRLDPASLWVRDLLESGRLGRLVLVQAEVKWYRTQEYYDSGDWRGTWALDGGGALMNQGVHTVDLMRWFAGPVERVSAVAGALAHERIEVEDMVCASLRFKNGALGTLTATTAAYPGFPAALHLHGTLGSVSLCGDEVQSLQLLHEENVEDAPLGPGRDHAVSVAQGGTLKARHASTAWEWGLAHKAQLKDFVSAVHEGRQPVVDGRAGKEAVEVVLAVYEAARTGREATL